MAAEVVFSGGHRVRVIGADAETLIQNLCRASQGPVKVPGSPYPLAEGWVDVQTEDEGVVLVNPAQVAYVRDVEDMPQVEETAGNLSDLEPRQVRA
jgi:hypothetical protein